MPVQFYMRGYNTAAPGAVGYVDWVVNDVPDSTGAFLPSPFLIANVINITINRNVQSKVENYLTSIESTGTIGFPDPGLGNFIHVNAYDFMHPSTPVGTPVSATPPVGISGLAVVRGTTDGTFSNPRPYASLFWEEDIQQWTFAFANDTFASIGALLPVNMGALSMSSPLTIGSPAANTGDIRLTNNATINARGFANFPPGAGGDLTLIGSDTSNHILHGVDGQGSGHIFNTLPGTGYVFESNSVANITLIENLVKIDKHVVTPAILQDDRTVGNGQPLTLQAQNTSAGASTGGDLNLTSGAGSSTAGKVNIQTAGNTKLLVQTASITQENSTYAFGGTADLVAVSSPTIKQNDLNSAGGTGQPLKLQAQNSVGGGSTTGGALTVTTGTGVTAGTMFLQTGGVNQIVVSPTNLPAMSFATTTGKVIITGNLEVQGTTTTVDSTVVDIIGRVIHANWTDPSITPNITAPTQITGYTVHRGNSSGVPRDAAGVIWQEGADSILGTDGYWKFVTITGDGYGTDGYTTRQGAANILGVMAKSFTASAYPDPAALILPSVGGLRAHNNTTTVAAKNLTATTTSTGSNTLPSTINVVSTTGFPSVGSLTVNTTLGFQTVTYTGTTSTTFTGVAGGSGQLSAQSSPANQASFLGSVVAAVPSTTTIAAGSNTQNLPQSTINVVSTTGFPTTGTILVKTNSGIQLVTYSGTGGTTFVGCTGGVGEMFTGYSVTSPVPTGDKDLLLLATDVANRIVHGVDGYNYGQIFNTASGDGYYYDFQVGGLSAYLLQPRSSGATVLQAAATVTSITYTQADNTATSTTGATTRIQAQNSTGGSSAGGVLNLLAGSGLLTGGNVLMTAGPGTSSGTGGAVNITAGGGSGSTTGGIASINGGSGTTVGGNVVVNTGTGSTTVGNVQIQTGGTDRIVVHSPTPGPLFIEIRDANEAYRFTPISAGTTTFQAATTVTSMVYNQADKTTNAGTGAPTTLQAQNETGTTSTGGALNLTSGTGTTTAGNTNIQTGGTTRVAVNPTFTTFNDTAEALRITPVSAGTTQITYASTVTAAQINQTATAGATGATMTHQAQNAATTGGALNLTSGTGTTAGNVNLQTGAVTRVSVQPTFTSFSDTSEAYRITPVSAGATTLQAITTATSVTYNQGDKTTNGGTGFATTLQAQNETGTTSTGGALNLTSGTGTTTAGNVNIQTGGTTRMSVNPTFVTYSDTAEAYRVTPVSAGTTSLQFATTVTLAKIFQADLTTNNVTANPMTIQSQNETGTTSTGGALNLTSGTGTTANGNVNVQSGGTTKFSVTPNKSIFSHGIRYFSTSVTTATYTVLVTDFILFVNRAGTVAVTLPASPTTGDTYRVKDISGAAATNNITVTPSAGNIDGAANFVISANYAAFDFIYNGTEWSVF